MLEEKHDGLDGILGDDNTCTLGRIGKHNVFVAGLPQGTFGINAPSGAATSLLRTFPNSIWIDGGRLRWCKMTYVA